MIRAIAAIDDKRGLADDHGIPWKLLPADRQYFRDKTLGGTLLMGWPTAREFTAPLSGRRNIVVSHQKHQVQPGFELVQDIDSFLKNCNTDVWVIGGAGLFASMLPRIDELYLTRVSGDYTCTKFFPEFAGSFNLNSESAIQKYEDVEFSFATYTRIKKPTA